MAEPESSGAEFNKKFFDWLSESVGISRELVASLDRDDDWAFVIKMHGILEAGLNHLLITHFGNPNFRSVISRLDTANERSGKLGFIKAADLLSEDARTFVKLFSDLRGRAVHDIKNFGLNLVTYVESLNATERNNWGIAMASWSGPPRMSAKGREAGIRNPRIGIYNSCMGVMIRCLEHQKKYEQMRVLLLKEIERAQSIPKEE